MARKKDKDEISFRYIVMPRIYNTREPFDFSALRLTQPIKQHGAHFIKTLVGNDDPLYILTPKCLVKQGFVSAKKTYCDLMFSNEDLDFLNWLERLEEVVRDELYKNREKWFETPLDEADIENSIAPICIQRGKFFNVRATVPTILGKVAIKIFDENETEINSEDVKENTRVICVLEIHGIKCSARGFHFEVDMKQMLIVSPENIFEKCIIGSVVKPASASAPTSISVSKKEEECLAKIEEPEKQEFEVQLAEKSKEELAVVEPAAVLDNLEPVLDPSEIGVIDIPLEQITEVNLEATESSEPMKLKNRNDVYYKLYKEAKTRAKEAKRVALENYLEAKRIKTTYLLEDMSEDEDEIEGTV